MLFAGDQKVEHLNDDFSGPGIHPDDGDPEHLFRIASKARIGVFATQLGMIAAYGEDYPNIPYLVKLNGKTNHIPTEQRDPISTAWYTVDDVASFAKHSGLSIHGVGYMLYPGSEYEHEMLREAAQVIRQAHVHGLVAVLWVDPRGKNVKDERNPHLIAGACGLAASIGSDFVKVNAPQADEDSSAALLKEAVLAAGRTRVICAGGPARDAGALLREVHEQIYRGGVSGTATGRNIHERALPDAIRMCNAISAVTFDNADIKTAVAIYQGRRA
jgi:DhnA family fructose-bisphosphate aldolase class Ia